MFQALIRKGRVLAEEVPKPNVSPGSVLIKVVYSCISAGTEISSVQASGMPVIKRAMQQPEKVAKAWQMFKTEGLAKTVGKVRKTIAQSKKDEEIAKPTGYSLSGVVLATGEGVTDLEPCGHVAAAGAGLANHAEFVDVPRNLVMRLPVGLDFKIASTATLGGIAMQGVRRAKIQLGEFIVVFGTGILGLLTVQMVKAAGGRCIAVDLDPRRLELATKFGAELTVNSSSEADPVGRVKHFTGGYGADAIIFTAATSQPVALTQAFGMTRKKGRLVMVGTYGKELHREDLYHQELDFLISTSYGPGRYDDNYERKGLDYPYAYVRWTENRNMKEFLRLLATGAIDVSPMIDAEYPIERVTEAFEFLNQPERPLLVLVDYGKPPEDISSLNHKLGRLEISTMKPMTNERIRVGLIGAGNFAKAVHLPNLQKLNDKYQLRAVCTRTGHTAKQVATQFGANYATTDYQEILSDPEIDLVMICTRHNLHGQMVLETLQAGKHTLVEKPLCTTQEELDAIKAFYESQSAIRNPQSAIPLLMVGFNRRFSKYAREAKKHTSRRINPLFIHYRMNAGYIPMDHWVHTEEGGGRIIGEACHIIDLFSYLVDAPVKACAVGSLNPKTDSISSSDNKSIILEYEDGSVATLGYFAVGSTELPKEYMQVHFDEKSIIMDDYKSIEGYGLTVADIKSRDSDKGQLQELEELAKWLRGEKNNWPIMLTCLVETTKASFILS